MPAAYGASSGAAPGTGAGEVAALLLAASLQILLVVLLVRAAWRWFAARRPAAFAGTIRPDGAGGQVVPLRAAFTGWRGLPWLALAFDNAAPRLTITPTGLRWRVLRWRSRPFEAIERVDLQVFGATVLLRFRFAGSPFTFDASLGATGLARAVLRLLPEEVPLSAEAAALRREG